MRGRAGMRWDAWGSWDGPERGRVRICCKGAPRRERRREEARNINVLLRAFRLDPGLCNRFGQPAPSWPREGRHGPAGDHDGRPDRPHGRSQSGPGLGGPEPPESRGARGIRTPDLFHAMEARYQLRHSPEGRPPSARTGRLVELGGFEPPTSSMPWKRATNCAIAPRTGADPRGRRGQL